MILLLLLVFCFSIIGGKTTKEKNELTKQYENNKSLEIVLKISAISVEKEYLIFTPNTREYLEISEIFFFHINLEIFTVLQLDWTYG